MHFERDYHIVIRLIAGVIDGGDTTFICLLKNLLSIFVLNINISLIHVFFFFFFECYKK